MYQIDLYTIQSEQDSQKFSSLEVTQVPLDDCLESTLEIAYAFQDTHFGVTNKEVSPVALVITFEGEPVVMADIKVINAKRQLEWRKPLDKKQLEGLRTWRTDLVQTAASETDSLQKKHLEIQIELVDVFLANGTNYCEPFRSSTSTIKRVKNRADRGGLDRAMIVGEIGYWGPQRTKGLPDPAAEKPKIQKMVTIGIVQNALVFGPKEFAYPGREEEQKSPELETQNTTPSSSRKDITGDADFVATIFFACIDPYTKLVLKREDVQISSSTSLREVIKACQTANPIFMKRVYDGVVPILIQVVSDGKLVALADTKRHPTREGYYTEWRAPLTDAQIADLDSKYTQLFMASQFSTLLEQSTSYEIQLESVEILRKGTEFSIPHEQFMEISKDISAELKSKGQSFTPGW